MSLEEPHVVTATTRFTLLLVWNSIACLCSPLPKRRPTRWKNASGVGTPLHPTEDVGRSSQRGGRVSKLDGNQAHGVRHAAGPGDRVRGGDRSPAVG